MIDDLPDCVLPSSQKTGAGVLARSSASVASRSGGGASSFEKIRFTTPQIRLMTSPAAQAVAHAEAKRTACRFPAAGKVAGTPRVPSPPPTFRAATAHGVCLLLYRMPPPRVLAPPGVRPLPPSAGSVGVDGTGKPG